MIFYVYVIKNQLSGKIYIGQTNNLKSRLERHNGLLPRKRTSFTNLNKGCWQLVYKEEFSTRTGALRREGELKSFQGRKFVRNIIEK